MKIIKHADDTSTDNYNTICCISSVNSNLPDTVENINEYKEQGDQEPHPAGHHLRLDQEADPAHNDKHAAW